MIILAVKENAIVYAYNEKKELCLQEQGDLYGYTSETVAIKRNACIYIYNESGTIIAEYPRNFIDMSNIIGAVL